MYLSVRGENPRTDGAQSLVLRLAEEMRGVRRVHFQDSNFHVLKNVLVRRWLIAEREHISGAPNAKSPQSGLHREQHPAD